jgi:hypothetical protein
MHTKNQYYVDSVAFWHASPQEVLSVEKSLCLQFAAGVAPGVFFSVQYLSKSFVTPYLYHSKNHGILCDVQFH